MSRPATPGQTVGPFFAFGLEYAGDSALVPADHPDAITLRGRVLDGAGEPVPDALVELWQAGPDGRVVQQAGSLRRDGETFTGWGRCGTDAAGRYAFTTLAPGAPFFALTVFARGLLDRLVTRAYLPDAADGPVPAGPRRPAEHPARDPRRGWLRLRHPAAGRRRDRLPRPSPRLIP